MWSWSGWLASSLSNQDGRRHSVSRTLHPNYDGGVPDQVYHNLHLRNTHYSLCYQVVGFTDSGRLDCPVCHKSNIFCCHGFFCKILPKWCSEDQNAQFGDSCVLLSLFGHAPIFPENRGFWLYWGVGLCPDNSVQHKSVLCNLLWDAKTSEDASADSWVHLDHLHHWGKVRKCKGFQLLPLPSDDSIHILPRKDLMPLQNSQNAAYWGASAQEPEWKKYKEIHYGDHEARCCSHGWGRWTDLVF